MANNPAFKLSVSVTVSNKSKSAPPLINARACCLNATTNSSNEIERKPGLFTSGDIDANFVVGPIEPATNRGLSGVFAVISSATSRAIFAEKKLMSSTKYSK